MQETGSLPDQIVEATNYIKKLQINLEKMKEKKNNLVGLDERSDVSMNRGRSLGLKSPQIEIQQKGSALEVALVTGLDCHFMFKETIRVLQEEGSDIVNASYTVAEDAVYHTIHCQVSYKFPLFPLAPMNLCNLFGLVQVGESANGAARISEKLKKFFDYSGAF